MCTAPVQHACKIACQWCPCSGPLCGLCMQIMQMHGMQHSVTGHALRHRKSPCIMHQLTVKCTVPLMCPIPSKKHKYSCLPPCVSPVWSPRVWTLYSFYHPPPKWTLKITLVNTCFHREWRLCPWRRSLHFGWLFHHFLGLWSGPVRCSGDRPAEWRCCSRCGCSPSRPALLIHPPTPPLQCVPPPATTLPSIYLNLRTRWKILSGAVSFTAVEAALQWKTRRGGRWAAKNKTAINTDWGRAFLQSLFAKQQKMSFSFKSRTNVWVQT